MKYNIFAPINTTSYGYVSTNIICELSKLGVEVCLFPINTDFVDSQEVQEICQAAITRSEMNFSWKDPSLRIWHQYDMAHHIGSPRVGFPIFELDDFCEMEKYHLRSLDRIFVCTHWAKKVIEDKVSNEIPVNVIPLGVNPNIFYPVPNQKSSSKIRILIPGKAEYRKGHDICPEVILRSGINVNDIEIWLMIENPFCTNLEMQEWYQSYKAIFPNVNIIGRLQNQKEIAFIYNSIDVALCLSRAEGWNMPALELMACGKRIIATNYSGHTEFCTKENCHLVDVSGLEEAYDGKFFRDRTTVGNWAKLDDDFIERAAGELSSYFVDSTLTKNSKALETAKQFTWTNTARKIIEVLK